MKLEKAEKVFITGKTEDWCDCESCQALFEEEVINRQAIVAHSRKSFILKLLSGRSVHINSVTYIQCKTQPCDKCEFRYKCWTS